MTGARHAQRIYSVGYEGLTLQQFINRMLDSQVTVVVDVRMTPSSRRPGFSKRTLSQALCDAGIGYQHEKELGNPPDNRGHFRGGSNSIGRERMRTILENGAGDALRRLVELTRTETVAVLCVERFATSCHREVITDMAREIEPSLEVSPVW